MCNNQCLIGDACGDRYGRVDKPPCASKTVVEIANSAQHRKGKIIAIDSTLDEVTVRMDIDQCSGYRIGEVVAITSPVE